MKVIEPGHVYELATLDGEAPNRLVFVNREPGTEHAGTQTQEALRTTIDVMECLIDRTNHCDDCIRWEGNDRIVKALAEAQRQMRLALLYHEQRAMERKLDRGDLEPEKTALGPDGHFVLRPEQCDAWYRSRHSTQQICCVLDSDHAGPHRDRDGRVWNEP